MRKLILVFVACLLASCATRKVQNQSGEVRRDTISKARISIKERLLTANNIITDGFTIEPMDNKRPMVIDGKEYNNARIRHDKKLDNTKYQVDRDIAKATTNQGQIRAKVNIKTTEKDGTNIALLGWAFIVILAWLVLNYLKSTA